MRFLVTDAFIAAVQKINSNWKGKSKIRYPDRTGPWATLRDCKLVAIEDHKGERLLAEIVGPARSSNDIQCCLRKYFA